MLIDYEKNSGINLIKLETVNENLRSIFDKRYNTAEKSFGLSTKKNFQRNKDINTENSIKNEFKFRSNIPSEVKDKNLTNLKFNELYGTPLKSGDRDIKL